MYVCMYIHTLLLKSLASIANFFLFQRKTQPFYPFRNQFSFIQTILSISQTIKINQMIFKERSTFSLHKSPGMAANPS